MKCPHCSVTVHVSEERRQVQWHSNWTGIYITTCHCPACKKYILSLDSEGDTRVGDLRLIVPQGSARGPVPSEVPIEIAEDYVEACNTLSISSKASAALARRSLQTILHSQGYKARDLASEIDLLLNETDGNKAIPKSLRETIDGIRNFGNFSAHPITDLTRAE
jgi:Domain of unknown function (DUF4145)